MAQERPHVEWRFPAYQIVFGSNPAELCEFEDKDGDLTFAQDSSLSRQFVQQWKLRILAQEAALREFAGGRLRNFLAYSKSFKCTGVEIRNTALGYKAQNKKIAPRWRGPGLILDIDETGVTATFQSQTFKVARFCVRKKVEAKDVEDAEVEIGSGEPPGASRCGSTHGCGQGGWEWRAEYGRSRK